MGKDASVAEKQAVATFLFRYFAPQILLLGINAIFMAILNSVGIFAITAAAPIINNVFMIATFLAYHYGWFDITGLAIGTTLGTAAMALVQLPFVIKAGMPIRPKFNLKHPVFKSVTSLGWPIALVSIANLVGWTIRTNLLSTVLGAFAIYTYCFQIIMMPYGIFAVSIATVLYPTLSRHAANKRREEFVGDMSLGFRWTLFILLPISLGVMALAMPIIRVLFEHRGGQFTFSDSLFASDFLSYYALSIGPYAMVMFATRVFYSMKDTGTPAVINIAGVVFNAVISYILLKTMGAAGIALGASLTYIVTTAVSMYMIRRETGGLGGRTFWFPIGKMLLASGLMAIAVHSAEVWSRPELVVVERGSRLSMPVPSSSSQGSYTILKSGTELNRVWTALGRTTETVPQIDFSKSQVALVWGPQSRTTSTLELLTTGSRFNKPENVRLSMAVRPVHETTTSSLAVDTPTSPAYALIQVRNPNAAVSWNQVIEAPGAPRPRAGLIDPELLRLVLLILLGAGLYAVSAVVFRMSELETATRQFTKRFNRRKQE
jgi:murein biosynthesis integral membrane protein MurJ